MRKTETIEEVAFISWKENKRVEAKVCEHTASGTSSSSSSPSSLIELSLAEAPLPFLYATCPLVIEE